MKTDTNRKLRTDKGNPEICPVFDYHNVFSTEEERGYICDGCTTANIGCIDCKKILIKNMLSFLEPIQNRRKEYEKSIDNVDIFLNESQKKANEIAEKTMVKVRKILRI